MISTEQLARATGARRIEAIAWLPHVVVALEGYGIDTRVRQAAFLAQVGHETQRLARISENLNYSAAGLLKTFPRHFTPEEAATYARQPARIANRVYARRLGNADEASGDGWRYRGRGLLQITGRANYRDCGAALGTDLLRDPDRLLEPRLAALSAGWYWQRAGLNEAADAGDITDVSRRVNGGANGLTERAALYAMALKALA